MSSGFIHYNIFTKNVDVNGGSGTSTGIDCLNDVGGSVSSGGVADGQLGVSWLCVNGDAVICPQDQVSLCPLHPRIRLSFDISRKLDLGSCPCSQTSQ